MVVRPLEAVIWHMSLVHLTDFDLCGMNVLNMLSLNIALFGVCCDLTLWYFCYRVLSL